MESGNEVKNLTPMLKQYLEIKQSHPDKILFFRMGDFYEMFFEDAKVASKILNIALTTRHKNQEDYIPMAGIPYHALSNYTQKLLDNGYKIAICEQVEDPKKAKTIVKREVVKILTPAINTELDNLDRNENYYLMALKKLNENFEISLLDFSSGNFYFETNLSIQNVISEIEKFLPKEILLTKEDYIFFKKFFSLEIYKIKINFLTYPITHKEVITWLKEKKVEQLFTIEAILSYILENNKFIPDHIKTPEKLNIKRYMELDENTIYHLEILTNQKGKKEGSLFSLLNNCFTPMGTRGLKKWITYPLLDKEQLEERYNFISELKDNNFAKKQLVSILKNIGDIERLNTKLALKTILPEDLLNLSRYLSFIPEIKNILILLNTKLSKEFLNNLPELKEIKEIIKKYILQNPSNNLNEGDYISYGINKELDELRKLKKNSKKWLIDYEYKLKQELQIPIKIKYNKVFGYFIEISKKNTQNVPSNFIRKQTLVNAERYITEELKEFEEKILFADEKITEIQKNLYNNLLEKLSKYCGDIKKISDTISSIDILTGFSILAIERGYCRPKINEENKLEIIDGKHPVLEKILNEEFIPNDLKMSEKKRIYIITGPNMAGKSTYLRQNALLILMAQIGSFVPAKKMNFSIMDRIFSRIGAKDNILSGESTFMVEMRETSTIIKNLTNRSFVILDEIGRGTSTYDGVSIAWAIIEYLANLDKKAFVLFATHYHELTALEESLDCVKNFSVDVKESGDKLLFLRKIKPGPTDKSYGIEVASLAKLPEEIIVRAKKILTQLEKKEEIKPITKHKIIVKKSIFQDELSKKERKVIDKIKNIDIDNITPLKALNLLDKLKKILTSG